MSVRVANDGAAVGAGHVPPSLALIGDAVERAADRVPGLDRQAMELVLLLHRVTNTIVYDLESSVHRPAGWSWSAFRAVFTLWISGPLEPSRLAQLSGMSRQAVSALAKTLAHDGVLERRAAADDGRSVQLALTPAGRRRIERVFRDHNEREARWAAMIDPAARHELTALLGRLAAAAGEPWVNHRD
jgi:DNA-binding MarR family transcriptional regulator